MIGVIIDTEKITNNIPHITHNITDPDNNSPPHNDLIEQIKQINCIFIDHQYNNNLDKLTNGLVVYDNGIKI